MNNAFIPSNETDVPIYALWMLLFLFTVVGVAGLFLRRLKISFTIGLVLVGLILAWLANEHHIRLLAQIHLTENLIIYVFLPVLIFGAALSLDTKLLKKNLVPILLLALPGVVFATLFTGVFTHYLTPLSWSAAFLFGALISTTDPVAVIATFREIGAPPRLSILVDGESLFNDATAIVMFSVVGGLIATSATPTVGTLGWAGLKFIFVFGGGFVIGWLLGEIAGLFNRLADKLCNDEETVMFGGLFSLSLAFCSFLLAQGLLDLSGVMAAVGAGISFAKNTKKYFGETALNRARAFWEMLVFLANGLIFLFLGMTEIYLVKKMQLHYTLTAIIAAVAIVIAARAALILGSVPLYNRWAPTAKKISSSYQKVMFWGGLRGALPIGLALSLRGSSFGLDLTQGDNLNLAEQMRQAIVLMTVAVVLFTLIVQGLTVAPLMRYLKVGAENHKNPPQEIENKKVDISANYTEILNADATIKIRSGD